MLLQVRFVQLTRTSLAERPPRGEPEVSPFLCSPSRPITVVIASQLQTPRMSQPNPRTSGYSLLHKPIELAPTVPLPHTAFGIISSSTLLHSSQEGAGFAAMLLKAIRAPTHLMPLTLGMLQRLDRLAGTSAPSGLEGGAHKVPTEIAS